MSAGKPLDITPALRAKVLLLLQYGLTMREVSARLSLAASTIHKIAKHGGSKC